MKALKHTSTLLMVFVLSLFLVNCEKVNPKMDLLVDPGSESETSQMKATQISSSVEIIYLISLIEEIESLLEEGLLNKGQANALIVKVENAIKSINKSNTSEKSIRKSTSVNEAATPGTNENSNGAIGPLNAFINQVNAFIISGSLPPEEGQSLINMAETAIILTEGGLIDPRDGQEYSVVLIGNQLWMAENLKATKFNDGTDIPLVENIDDWTNLSTPGYCWYNNDFETYGTVYGGLYNWYAVNTGKLSPEGWHVPSDEEWHTLILTLDPDPIYGEYGPVSEIAGGKLKEIGTDHWLSPNEGATDEFGFTALGADARYLYRENYFIGVHAHWWSSTEYSEDEAWIWWLINDLPWVYRISPDKRYGLSVRCIKD